MIAGVADTHTAVWYLANDPRLSRSALAFVERIRMLGHEVAVSSISLVELVYLEERGRVASGTVQELKALLDDPGTVLTEVGVNGDIAMALARVSRDQVPDMPDRIIAATAVYLGVPVLSRDGRIRASGILTVW